MVLWVMYPKILCEVLVDGRSNCRLNASWCLRLVEFVEGHTKCRSKVPKNVVVAKYGAPKSVVHKSTRSLSEITMPVAVSNKRSERRRVDDAPFLAGSLSDDLGH